MEQRCDVFVSGGGIAGLAAALGMARAGLDVVLAEPGIPPKTQMAEASDLRSTAFLQPSRDVLEQVGVWEALAPHATPLRDLRVIDLAGDPPEVQVERVFRSSDLGEVPFAWNLPNWQVREVMTKAAGEKLDLRMGVGFDSMLTRDREARVRLSDGSRLRAALVLAADGRGSPVRAAAGIDARTARYGQKALAFVVAHERPHCDVSSELYLQGGAFTLVPLPDQGGRACSAVVWMSDGPESVQLMALDDAAFSAAASARSAGVLGALEVISPRRIWPVVTQLAERMVGRRVALLAEAAHVLPPIGAQGLNTSLSDVAALLALVNEGLEPGSDVFLQRYEAARARDVAARARVIDGFNRLCRSGEAPVQALRGQGLKLVHDLAPLRASVMRAGLG